MRLARFISDPPRASYLSRGETYELATVNGGNCDGNIYFQRAGGPYPCGTYIRESEFKRCLRNGSLVFVD